MKASSTAYAVYITERDLQVLQALAEYRFLSIPQLSALYFPTKGATEARLRRLSGAKLVVKVFMPARPYDRRTVTIYALGAPGARLLLPHTEGVRPRHLSPHEQRSGLFLDHTLRRNDLRICLELLSRRPGILRLVLWQQLAPEVKARAEVLTRGRQHERVTVIPDGCFLLWVNGQLHAFAVEIDMGTVSLKRMAVRYQAYFAWWRAGEAARRYPHASFRVLTLTTTPRRLEALRKAATAAPCAGQRGSGLFWFALLAVADIEEPTRLLDATWFVAQRQPASPQPLLRL